MSLSRFHPGKFGMFQESRLDTGESLPTDVKKKKQKKERRGAFTSRPSGQKGNGHKCLDTSRDGLSDHTGLVSSPPQTTVSWWKQLGPFKIYGTMSFCVTTDQQYAYSSAASTRWGKSRTIGRRVKRLGSFVKRLTRTGGNTPCSCNVSPDDVFRNDVNVIVCAAAVEMPFCCQTCLTSSTGI